MVNFFPSLIASNPLTLEKTLHHLQDACSGFHVDIMDNHFVPNLGFSVDMANAIRGHTPLPLWTHLMVYYPEKYIPKLALQQGDIVSLHYESAPLDELKGLLKELQQRSIVAGIALQPSTPLSVLVELIGYIDHVLIMSVQSGFSGQQFIPATVGKLHDLARMQEEHHTAWRVGVDGGINLATLQEVLPAGATDIALGSSLFVGHNPAERLEQFFKLL